MKRMLMICCQSIKVHYVFIIGDNFMWFLSTLVFVWSQSSHWLGAKEEKKELSTLALLERYLTKLTEE